MKEIEEEIMIQYYNGSIFDSKADILCHQVNCQGAFGYGIAGQVKKLFPEVEKTYKRITKQWIEKENGDTSKLLGRVSAQPVEKDGRWFLIGNLYGQDDYGRKKMVYTDYDALEKAMGEIRSFLEARGKNETVAFPYKIGCGSAGGDWNIAVSYTHLDVYKRQGIHRRTRFPFQRERLLLWLELPWTLQR